VSDRPAPARLGHDASTGLTASILRAARVLSRRTDAALRHLSLNTGQLILLSCLDVNAPPPIGEVAAALGADRTTVTARLKPLLRRRLVAVLTDPKHARLRRFFLTEEGCLLLSRGLPVILDADRSTAGVTQHHEQFQGRAGAADQELPGLKIVGRRHSAPSASKQCPLTGRDPRSAIDANRSRACSTDSG
jgi:DNA-binding MarR family transcriptional regulator